MQDINQVFLYMKDEIERQAQNEEAAILDEVKAMEEEAYTTMKEEAKKDAELLLKQEEEELISKASLEIAKSHNERVKKLLVKRQEYEEKVFDEVCKQLMDFSKSKEYRTFLKEKIEKIKTTIDCQGANVYVRPLDKQHEAFILECFEESIHLQSDESITLGGLRVSSKDNSLEVDETIDHALEQQKEWFIEHSGLVIQ